LIKVSANPNKKLCMQIHGTLFFRKIIANKARNGSIETLMEASIIHNIPAANHRELGINNAAEAKIAPAKKVRFVPFCPSPV
jgi:hypothetical protein